MRLTQFCPGEGSRFLVAAAVLPAPDARPIGGSDETVLIVFGTEREMLAHPFECNPRKRDILARSYVAEKFPRMFGAVLTAAHYVISHLLGREAFGADHSPDALGWDPLWEAALLPLVQEIMDGLERGGNARSIAAYLPVLAAARRSASAANALTLETLQVFGGTLVSPESPESEVSLG